MLFYCTLRLLVELIALFVHLFILDLIVDLCIAFVAGYVAFGVCLWCPLCVWFTYLMFAARVWLCSFVIYLGFGFLGVLHWFR